MPVPGVIRRRRRVPAVFRFAVVALAVVSLAVALGATGPLAVSRVAAATQEPICPGGPVTLALLVTMHGDPARLGTRYDTQTNEHAVTCFGDADITVTGFVASPEGLGGVVAYTVSPAWMDTWNARGSRFLAVGDRMAAPGAAAGPFLAVAVAPDLLESFDGLAGSWVTVTGQFDAPDALGCSVHSGIGGSGVPDARDIVELCRTSFVVDRVTPAADVCPGDPDLAAVLAVPDEMRAACFGDNTLQLEGWGWTLMNTWPGVQVPPSLSRDFALAPDLEGDSLWVFLPPSVALPPPEGTPWAERDGIAPGDAWWRITGHFADQRADDCRPRDGDTTDGLPVVFTPHETQAFCRNHFVITRLVWVRDHLAPTSNPGPNPTATPTSTEGQPASPSPSSPAAVATPAPAATSAAPGQTEPGGVSSAGGTGLIVLAPLAALLLGIAVLLAVRRRAA